MDRGQFFQEAFRRVVGGGLKLVEDTAVVKALEEYADDTLRERPPGAVAEDRFQKLCTGCDKCMIACPIDVIMVDDIDRRLPVIYPEEGPCIHCDGYPCVAACPTGALQANILEK